MQIDGKEFKPFNSELIEALEGIIKDLHNSKTKAAVENNVVPILQTLMDKLQRQNLNLFNWVLPDPPPTPTPWYILDDCIFSASEKGIGNLVCQAPLKTTELYNKWRVNAKLIVRDVNQHDELIDLLRWARNHFNLMALQHETLGGYPDQYYRILELTEKK